MEIQIPKEIKNYSEGLVLGLSIRQTVFSALALIGAVTAYLTLSGSLGDEAASWVCVLVAVPFVLLGFYKFNGLPFEQFVRVWIRTNILTPKVLVYRSENLYFAMLKDMLAQHMYPNRRTKKGRKGKKNEITNKAV